MGSSRPGFNYSSVSNRWELRGKGGKILRVFDDAQADIGVGRTFTRIGSPAAIAAVGSMGNLGSIPCSGVAANDMVFAVPLTAVPTGVILSNIRASGAGNVNFVAKADDAVASMPAMGWRVFVTRAIP